ncbi:MAG: hypothetical protein Q8L13_11810 [Bradyrhizobium sp.]|uniref:hypothetical protein n=1 Tax=Bradyrhizobium sp. TaxID=376 RepID=UPI00272EFB16|nr:hypothetical protein [Bradyrhizobium sp.]MDP1867011.1 hypothetical protein [Bradyrhizobium sp.]
MTVKAQERSWRINIETPLGADPVVTVFREVVRTASDGAVIARDPAGSFDRSLSASADQVFTVSGNKYTVGEIAVVIAAIADAWRQEDLDAAAAAAAALERDPR